MPTLHVHFDEAGNWDFSPKGSAYYVIAAAWTYNPQPLAQDLTNVRFELLRSGLNIERFHASPDKQAVRDRVVRVLLQHADWCFGAVVMEKRKINPVIREPTKFYPTFAGALFRFVLRRLAGQRPPTRVLAYTDSLPLDTRAKREGVLKAIKRTCVAELPGTPYHIFSHVSASNKWLQVVDYCCWGVGVKWERSEWRTYNQLRPRMAAQELNITDQGDGTTYY